MQMEKAMVVCEKQQKNMKKDNKKRKKDNKKHDKQQTLDDVLAKKERGDLFEELISSLHSSGRLER